MKGGSKRIRSIRKRLRKYASAAAASTKKRRIHRRLRNTKSRKHASRRRLRRTMRGGTYLQFGSNNAYTPSYSVAGVELSSQDSALASPPPITPHPCGGGSCFNAYNHYTGKDMSV
jgi:hypothetical protein